MSFIYNFFKLNLFKTNIKTEFIAAVTTYVSACYILFVNPIILSNSGMPQAELFTATIVAIVVSTLVIGIFANTPILFAPGMGANSWFAFTVVVIMGFTWNQALAAVFLSGILFIIFTVTRVRALIVDSFSKDMKLAIGAGIGLFIALIGLKLGKVLIPSDVNIIQLGDVTSIPVIMTFLGLMIIVVLNYFNFKSSYIISIAVLSFISFCIGDSTYTGVVSFPTGLSTIMFAMDFSMLFEATFIAIVITIFIVDFLDSTGAFISTYHAMGVDAEKDKRFGKSMFLDGVVTSFGASVGTSTMAPFIESAAGVKQGGRTGLTAVFIALLFAVSLLFSPLLSLIPAWATAPALIYVGFLMFRSVLDIDFKNMVEGFPAFLTIFMMPFAASITHGIGIGVLAWIVTNIVSKQFIFKKHFIILFIAVGYIFTFYVH